MNDVRGMTGYAEALAKAGRAACASPAAAAAAVIRVEIPAPSLDPLAWLAAQSDQKRGYWADRDGHREVALVGEADEIQGPGALDFTGWSQAMAGRFEHAVGEVRYYGGFRFGPWHERDHAWRPFGAYRFILPRLEAVRVRGQDTALALNLVRDHDGHWPDIVAPDLRPCAAHYEPAALPRVVGRKDEPDAATWAAGVQQAQAAMQNGDLRKIVLARRALLALASPADPLALLQGIRRETGNCFQFCGSHGAGFAFVGASPELLFRRTGRHLNSEAVAGTRPRGASEAEDRALEAELRTSSKEAQEHRVVRDRIVRDLGGLCAQVESDPGPRILKLGRVQHLHTPIRAELLPGISDAEVLARLHPTPATAGEPVSAALKLMGTLEPFDRGWYAGPVGWVGRDAAEFAVALRCGLVAQSHLILFAGAGIMPGSEAASEAAEIEAKLAPFLRLLHVS